MYIIYLLCLILFLTVIYILMIMPKMLKKADFSPFLGRYYAHRGLHNNETNAPENSLKAFELAVSKGYGIELDIQLTKDNIPVVFHDYNLKRACGINKRVRELTYEEIKTITLFKSEEKIPTFNEALMLINGSVPIIIELKIEKGANRLCKIANKSLHNYKGLYCIESFNPLGLIWYRRKNPNVIRGQLSMDFINVKESQNKFINFLLRNLLLNFLTKPDFIAYNYIHCKKNLSYKICRNLFKVKSFAWTIRSNKALEESKNRFDAFIFDSFIPDIIIKKT